MQKVFPLKGDVKHYDWGGTNYIPQLLQIENPNAQPFAEYWMGAHTQANSMLVFNDGESVLLRNYILSNKRGTLGEKVNNNFGNMPFLLKVLDVKNMLSIQVHPSKRQAEIDFEEENKKGIALNAPNRNYKDPNHKPELMVALSGFFLLHGFKPEDKLLGLLNKTSELNFFAEVFRKEGYAGMYKLAMEMPQEEVNEVLQPLVNRIIPLYQQDKLSKEDENFWAARAAVTFAQPNVIDRGIFSIYFFNLLYLNTGEGIFQDAGLPHAYLEGQNVEIMASSDNVLRGGLTTKNIDTKELLKHAKCEATFPKIIRKQDKNLMQVYKTTVKDFELSSFKLTQNEQVIMNTNTTEIFLLISGEVEINSGKDTIVLKHGNIAGVAFAGTEINIKAKTNALLFRATVP
jgi:mannose-6-phosphate isomerase